MVCLYLWVQRHRHPDVARLKVLRVLLWSLSFTALMWLLAVIAYGPALAASETVLVAVFGLCLPAISIAFEIRQCLRRIKSFK